MYSKLIRFGRTYAAWLGLIVILVAAAVPRLSDLDRYVTPDEVLWLTRSANFYYALTHQDFAATYQKEHPGVMVMWAGTAGYLSRFPLYRGSGLGQVNPAQLDYYFRTQAPVSALSVLAAGRFFMAFGQTLILGLAFLYLQRMAGATPALLGMLLVALDPFHIAFNKLLHLDGLLSNLMLLSTLAFIYALQTHHKRHLMFSGLVAGLSWLTKSPGLFLAPILGPLALIDLVPGWRWQDWQGLSRRLYSSFVTMLIWVVSAALVFILLWPAMWIEPAQSIEKILGEAQQYSEGGHSSPVFFNGQILEDGRITAVDFYLVAYLWRATPFTLLGLALVGWAILGRWAWFREPKLRRLLLGLGLLAILFALAMTYGTKKFDRYLLPAFAPLDILAGLGFAALARFARQRAAHTRLFRLAIPLVFLLAAGGQAVSALGSAPYFLTYFNPMLGGITRAQEVMQIGWGEGLDLAGRYLNQKENAADLHVSSWYAMGSFSYYFSGHTRFIGSVNKDAENSLDHFTTSDYAVIYIHQWQRYTPHAILDAVSQLTPEYSIWLNGIEYVRIYRLR